MNEFFNKYCIFFNYYDDLCSLYINKKNYCDLMLICTELSNNFDNKKYYKSHSSKYILSDKLFKLSFYHSSLSLYRRYHIIQKQLKQEAIDAFFNHHKLCSDIRHVIFVFLL